MLSCDFFSIFSWVRGPFWVTKARGLGPWPPWTPLKPPLTTCSVFILMIPGVILKRAWLVEVPPPPVYGGFTPPLRTINYRKSSIKPRGAYLLFAVIEGGLNREGGLLERGAYYKHEVKIYKTVLMHFHGKIYKTKTLPAAAWVCTHLVSYNILILHSHQLDQGC